MQYINNYKIFEAESHWKDKLYDVVSFDKYDDIKEIFYEFQDLGIPVKIGLNFVKNDFGRVSQKLDFIDNNVNLYKCYRIKIILNVIGAKDINKILEIKELEISMINRLLGLGLKIEYNQQNTFIYITVYHPDDFVDKELFISDLYKLAGGIEGAYCKAKDKFNKIANVWWIKDEKAFIIEKDPFNQKYDLDQIYIFVTKILKDCKIEKVKLTQDHVTPAQYAIKVS